MDPSAAPPSASAHLIAGPETVEPIPATKLVPPRAPRRLMAREGLLARVVEARRHRCVLIRSAAGSGKTSLLVATRQALLALDIDVAWLSIAVEDNDASRFFDCLLASLAQVDPAMVREATMLMGREHDEAAIELRVIALVQGIAVRSRQLVLMLDDLHNVDDERIGRALQWLLDYAPPNLHLLIATRQAPPFSLAALRAREQAVEFNLRDLLFTEDETERFLRQRWERIERRDALVMHRLTDGWVAGLQLLTVGADARRPTPPSMTPLRDVGAFRRYVEHEVLERLSAEDRALLTRMSICNRFSAQLCATLAGLPHAVAHMMVRLTGLDGNDLFISQIHTRDRETWYRLHPLLREVLQLQVAEWPEGERQTLHALAWRWFEDHGHIDEAVRHAVLAGDADAAGDLVQASADSLLSRGDYSQFASLLRRLPPEQSLGPTRIGLRIAMARLQLYRGDVDGLADSVARIRHDVDLGGVVLNVREQHDLVYLRGGLALQRDDPDEMQACLPELQDMPAAPGDLRTAGRSNVLGWMYLYRGEFEQARRVLVEAVEPDASPQSRLTGQCLLGLNHSLQGQMAQAEAIFHDVLRQADQQGPAFAVTAQMAACLLADTLYERNDAEAVCELLERRVDIIEQMAIPDAVYRALRSLSLGYRLLGRALDAWSCVERLEEYGSRHRLERLQAHALNIRVHWHLRDGEREQAARALDQLQRIEARKPRAGNSADQEIVLCAARSRVAAHVHDRRFEAAQHELQRLLEVCERSGRSRHAAGGRLQLSLTLAKNGRPLEARAQLLESLRLGHRLGLVRTLLDTSSTIDKVLTPLLTEGGVEPVLVFYVRRLLASGQRRAVVPPAVPVDDFGSKIASLSEREVEVLRLLSQTMANKRIARVLNVSPDTVKWHLKNIYAKLGVSGRDEAVARLRDA